MEFDFGILAGREFHCLKILRHKEKWKIRVKCMTHTQQQDNKYILTRKQGIKPKQA